jgi:hypothetical protein
MILNIITASKGGLPPLRRGPRRSAAVNGPQNSSKSNTDDSRSNGSRPLKAPHSDHSDRRSPAEQPLAPPSLALAMESPQAANFHRFFEPSSL